VWAISVLAVPVLYVLSVVPLRAILLRPAPGGYGYQEPAWFRAYYQPYRWAHYHTPLRGLLNAYADMVSRRWGPSYIPVPPDGYWEKRPEIDPPQIPYGP
jgi:hypothetical protein